MGSSCVYQNYIVGYIVAPLQLQCRIDNYNVVYNVVSNVGCSYNVAYIVECSTTLQLRCSYTTMQFWCRMQLHCRMQDYIVALLYIANHVTSLNLTQLFLTIIFWSEEKIQQHMMKNVIWERWLIFIENPKTLSKIWLIL